MCVEIRAWLLLAASLLLVASVLPDGILSRLIGVAGIFGAVGASVKGGQLFALEKGWVESFSCSPFAQFPKWLPLHEWAPYVFQPQAVCGEDIKSILFVPLSAWPLLMTLFIVALCGSAMLKTKK